MTADALKEVLGAAPDLADPSLDRIRRVQPDPSFLPEVRKSALARQIVEQTV